MMDMSVVIEGTTQLKLWNNAITSISKIGEYVSFEITSNKLLVTCFNASESVLATMELSKSFFRYYKVSNAINESINSTRGSKRSKYSGGGGTNLSAKFQLQSKVLISIFKRIEKDSNIIQKCKLTFMDAYDDISDDEDDLTNNMRITSMHVEIVLLNGMSRIYQTPCIDVEQIYRGGIDKKTVTSWFKVDISMIKAGLVHSSYRAEEMDICIDESQAELATFTRAIIADKEILKQPLQTRFTIPLDQFDSMDVKLGAQVSYRFKEFGIMMNLAENLSTVNTMSNMSYMYLKTFIARPGLPMLFELEGNSIPDGVDLQFMFMTNAEEEDDGEQSQELDTRRITKTSNDTRITIKSSVSKLKSRYHDHPRKNSDSSDPNMEDETDIEATVTWDGDNTENHPEPISIDMGTDNEDDEFDEELVAFTQRLDNMDEAVLGPTQGASQAKGLFD